ncbi:battenin-like [Tribolium castaneum]|uniref:battenin-like n=1 Tax=Tribolium castaneum TaxID=7070 RepID=UPI0000D5648E|nr:PREDICTED: battenin-like [Tribolium castaneum]|eukprot:XP_969480.1 PREDICTED: battenin-like [Tribolium castaneum]
MLNEAEEELELELPKKKPWRALISFWIFGLCNNYGYVVMLTAAADIIFTSGGKRSKERECTYVSTGTILLADIIPGIFAKLVTPFVPFCVRVRIVICVLLSASGFLFVGCGRILTLSIIGVVATSFSSGLGEVTFLQYSSYYDSNVLSTWSSGTGGAGVIGALSYALLQNIGFTLTLMIMLLIPSTMALTFFMLLPKPQPTETAVIQQDVNAEEIKKPKETLIKKIMHIPSLCKYMIPFGLVYFLEYFINQGTFELIHFKNTRLSPDDQYRWLQVIYQVGVFISRSSANLFYIKQIWIMSVLQAVNVAIFTTEVIYFYLPNFWIVVALTLWEGLLGGAAYVNTYYRIRNEVKEEMHQFSMAITSFSDSIGISLAGIVAVYAHNAICDLPMPKHSY